MKKFFTIILFVLLFSVIGFSQNDNKYFHGLNYFENNQPDSALLVLNDNNDEESIILMSKIFIKKNDINSAIKILTEAINNNPSKNIIFEMAKIYAGMEFEDEAIFYLSRYFENNQFPLYYSQIIQINEFQKIEYSSAWLNFWKTNNYNNNYAVFEEVVQLQSSKKYDEAISVLNNIPDNSYSFLKNYYLAESYYNLNDYKSANYYISLSASQNKKYNEILKLKYNVERENKKYSQALATITLLQTQRNNDRKVIFDKAEIYYLMEEKEKAANLISDYLKYFPKDDSALLLKSKIDISLNRRDDALLSLNKIILADKTMNEEARLLRADVFFDYGLWESAQKDYSMLLDINPRDGEIYYKYGISCLKMEMTDKACHNLKKAVQLRYKKAQKEYYKNCE